MHEDARVALVTGSTSGIGLGIAEALAAEGMDLMLNGIGDAAQIERTRARIEEEYGVRVGHNGADLSSTAQVRALVEATRRGMGHVDVLVNNAGIQFTARVHEFPVDRWDAILAINLSAAFHSIAAALPQMLERNWGRIVNVSSVHGNPASTEAVAYVAARHGVMGLTKVVTLETARTGITCNAVCPAGEFASPEQIGALTAFLCSEDAAQIRGVALPVDGGWTAQQG